MNAFYLLLGVCLLSSAHGFGEPVKIEDLGAEENATINFAFSQLTGGDTCKREIVKVVDFFKQVVAGVQYIFHLQLAPNKDNPASCGDQATETCKLVVWERAWEDYKEVQWHNVTCTRHYVKNGGYSLSPNWLGLYGLTAAALAVHVLVCLCLDGLRMS